jgi:ethanolamine phosphate transferase 2 subunit G
MIPKHMEMDGIVRQIYDAMTRTAHLKDTLLVLCGDHGMNEAGNHGGSGFGETSTALVFISAKLKPLHPGRTSPVAPHTPYGFDFYKGVDQSDVAATISSLLGLPVPRNNLGVVIPDFLRLWKDRACSRIATRFMLTVHSKGSDAASASERVADQVSRQGYLS